ncbi:MAG: hypothetical protein E7253_05165 [Lachnospiraceae bacterium]|nr:hypothetical protein [Lachnospiraceae bacterium]
MDNFKIPELNMLNAALPYVSDRMQKPLALFLKSSEIRQLYSDFDSEEFLSACGLEKSPPDPEAMLKAMKAAGGKHTGPQIDQLLQMMNLIKTYQKLNEMMQQNPELINFLANTLNQSQTPNTHYTDKMSRLDSAPANNLVQAADLLKQFGNSDSSDMMALLTQMLKNSR